MKNSSGHNPGIKGNDKATCKLVQSIFFKFCFDLRPSSVPSYMSEMYLFVVFLHVLKFLMYAILSKCTSEMLLMVPSPLVDSVCCSYTDPGISTELAVEL